MCGAVAGKLHAAALVSALSALAVLSAGATETPGSLRVVALLSGPVPARRQWVTPLLDRLSKRGHRLDVLEMQPELAEDAPDITRLQGLPRGCSETVQGLRDAHRLGRALSEWQLRRLPALLDDVILRGPVDVLLADYNLNDAAILVAWWYLRSPSAAVVLVSPEAAPPRWVLRAAASPPPPLAAPGSGLGRRLRALALTVYDHFLYHWKHLPAERLLAAETLQGVLTGDIDAPVPIALVLTNELAGLDQDGVRVPRLQQVAGLSADKMEPAIGKGLRGMQLDAVVLVGERALPLLELDGLLEALDAQLGAVLLCLESHSCWLMANATRQRTEWTDLAALVLHSNARPLVAVWLGAPALAHAAALAGVPQLGLPMDAGEAELVDKLAATGAAVRLDIADLQQPTRLAAAIGNVLNSSRVRWSAEALSGVLRSAGPPALERAAAAVELAPRLGAARPPPLLQVLQVDALLALALLALLAAAAAATFSALLLTLLCYRKRTRSPSKQKRM